MESELFWACDRKAGGFSIAHIGPFFWHLVPKPKEAPSLDQEMDAFAKHFPWLSQKPEPVSSPLDVKTAPQIRLNGKQSPEIELAPIVTLHKTKDEHGNYMHGGTYGLETILRVTNPKGGYAH
jgi:hypothetical protein